MRLTTPRQTVLIASALLTLTFLGALNASEEHDSHPVMMWEVSGKSNRIYILGSIHLLREKDHPLPEIIGLAYDEAEILIMEIDMDDLDPLASQAEINRLGMLQDVTTLADLMGEEAYSRAANAAAEMQIPFDMLSRTEPWLAAMTVESLALDRIGFNPMLGIEMVMTNKAVADGKPIEGLETLSQQLRFLDELSMEAQVNMLLTTLEEGAALESTMEQILRAWRYGDTDTLEQELLLMQEHEELNKVLINDRNNRWVEQLVALMQDSDDYLVIVGALHLVGDNGVPQQLADRNIPIRQLEETVYLSTIPR